VSEKNFQEGTVKTSEGVSSGEKENEGRRALEGVQMPGKLGVRALRSRNALLEEREEGLSDPGAYRRKRTELV